MQQTAIAVRDQPAPPAERTVDEVLEQVAKVHEVMRVAMDRGQHFGTIPGTDKPTLFQPGAQKLTLLFRMAPRYRVDREDHERGHRTYEVICGLYQQGSDVLVGEGVGVCSTLESKYRWRAGFEDTGEAIPEDARKRKREYRDAGFGMRKDDAKGWIWVRYVGKQENEDIADTYNTVLKMAKKRAFVDAVLTATAASDVFTQDVAEEPAEPDAPPAPPAPPPTPTPEQRAPWWDGDDEALELVTLIEEISGKLNVGSQWMQRMAYSDQAEGWTRAAAMEALNERLTKLRQRASEVATPDAFALEPETDAEAARNTGGDGSGIPDPGDDSIPF